MCRFFCIFPLAPGPSANCEVRSAMGTRSPEQLIFLLTLWDSFIQMVRCYAPENQMRNVKCEVR